MEYKAELVNLLENTNNWESLKEKLERSYNTSIQNDGKKSTLAGKLFEYFAKYFFICNPLYQSEYKNIWLFDEIPLDIKKELNINHTPSMCISPWRSRSCTQSSARMPRC